jgi:hypothetical protein
MSQAEFVRQAILDAQATGDPLTREGLMRAYLAELDRSGSAEDSDVSERWVDLYWARLQDADLKAFMHAARHHDQFSKLAATVFPNP